MNRLAPAALLALLPTLARASGLEEAIIPIGVVGTVFGFTAVIVAVVAWAAHRNAQLRHETIRLALEKGQQLPADLLDPDRTGGPAGTARRDLRRGLVLVAVGLGVCLTLLLSGMPGMERQWAAGLIPGLVGAAYLVSATLARRELRRAPDARG